MGNSNKKKKQQEKTPQTNPKERPSQESNISSIYNSSFIKKENDIDIDTIKQGYTSPVSKFNLEKHSCKRNKLCI